LRTKCCAFCGDEASGQLLLPAAHYQAVPAGSLVALIGSSGLLEISVNGSSAAAWFKLRMGNGFSVGWGRPEKPIIS
jgi:S-adenosylmethionine hydrolase